MTDNLYLCSWMAHFNGNGIGSLDNIRTVKTQVRKYVILDGRP